MFQTSWSLGLIGSSVLHRVNICASAMCKLFAVLFCESVHMKLLDAIKVHVYEAAA